MQKAEFCWYVSGMLLLPGSNLEPACVVKTKLAKRQRAWSTALAAPSSHLPAGGDGDLLACPLQTPAPFPAPAVMAAGRAWADPACAGRGDTGQAAQESGGAGVEEPRLSREAPGESKRREEPE